MKRLIVLLLGLLMVASANAWAADFVWLEGEAPTSANVEAKGQGWSNADYLSGGQWLIVQVAHSDLAKLPKEGVLLGYDFTAPSAGHYQIWDRIGYEFVRSPFDWRIDGGEWKTIKPTDFTTDCMDLSEWVEMAWIQARRGRPDGRQAQDRDPADADHEEGEGQGDARPHPLRHRRALRHQGPVPPERQVPARPGLAERQGPRGGGEGL